MPAGDRPGLRPRKAFSGLEALGRLLCGIAPWLERSGMDGDGPDLRAIHQLIAMSCAPSGAAALNFTYDRQPLVDAAFLAQAVLRAPTALWTGLPEEARAHLADALRKTRAIEPHDNNWLLFSAMIEAFFCRIGLDWDRKPVDHALRRVEQWYVGDGLYSDGAHFRLDYYNAYVIQPMLLDILEAVGSENEEWAAMAEALRQRTARLAILLERMIGPDGTFPPIGRSIVYRGAAFQPLAQLALHSRLPDALAPGQVRSALGAVIDATLGGDGSFDEDGWLRIGLNGAQPALAERYISTGSLYLCSTIFLPLGLAPDDPYWTDASKPWTQRKLWTQGADLPPDSSFDG